MARKQNKIRNLRSLRNEIEKTRVAADYTKEDLDESTEMFREKVMPSQVTNFVDQVIPIAGQVLPIGRLFWNVMPHFKSRKQSQNDSEAGHENDEEGSGEQSSFWNRFKRGTVKVLLPFTAGTLAAGGFWLSRKMRNGHPD